MAGEAEAVQAASQGMAGLSPIELMRAGSAMATVQEMQRLQKAYNDKSLQPGLGEMILNVIGRGVLNPMFQARNEQKQLLAQQMRMYMANLFQTGQEGLMPALFKPMGDEEMQQLVQGHMAARQQAYA